MNNAIALPKVTGYSVGGTLTHFGGNPRNIDNVDIYMGLSINDRYYCGVYNNERIYESYSVYCYGGLYRFNYGLGKGLIGSIVPVIGMAYDDGRGKYRTNLRPIIGIRSEILRPLRGHGNNKSIGMYALYQPDNFIDDSKPGKLRIGFIWKF